MSQDITSSSSTAPLAGSVGGTETSTRIFPVMESSTGIDHVMESSEKATETPSDNTKTSEYSEAAQSDNIRAVTETFTDFPETTPEEIKSVVETLATKVKWPFHLWFFCIVVLVAFLAVLLKVLVNRHDRRAYVVNKKCASTESHC
ncbi:hypothetical protein KR038_008931 [Drosophila bunnanda]|nr:hypothetical protein KR038_008931 [Drosophila bunnanda]